MRVLPSTPPGKKKTGSIQLLNDFGSTSTIHGLSYILGKDGTFCDRLLWLVIFLIAGCLAVVLTIRSFNDWQDNQVITTLKDIAKPIKGMDFPAVTICANGLHVDLVEKVLFKKFEVWKVQNNETEDKSLDQYLLETFQIQTKDTNILDILNTMVSPSDESTEANFVMQNQLACRDLPNRNKRKKRQAGI